MQLTVAVCTWNRAELLDRMLSSLRGLLIPDGVDWELIVVDNNSTDSTGDVLKAHSADLPLRGLFEPEAGKSFALNRAAEAARGDFVVWTDDDVRVDEGWLAAYHEAILRHPGAAFFGGTVKPDVAGTPPPWLEEALPEITSAYALREFQATSPVTTADLPYGVNWAVKRTTQLEYLYDTRIGPRPNSELRGEDTRLVRQMMADGLDGKWVPDAVVWHHIPKQRQSLRYIRNHYRGLGEYYALSSAGQPGRRFLGKPLWVWREVVEAESLYRYRRLTSGPRIWMKALVRASQAWGYLLGSRSKNR